MSRPFKDPALRMSADLRIPVTEEQKQLITQAAASRQSDFAAWARPILLKAAQQQLASISKKPILQK